MKNRFLLLFLFAACLASIGLSGHAQTQGCFECQHNNTEQATCAQSTYLYNNGRPGGWTGCGIFYDSHGAPGDIGPWPAHCHMSNDFEPCDLGNGSSGGSEELPPACPSSPIVINLGSGRYRLSGIDDPVLFDMNGDGIMERITWTERGVPTMAFLVWDRNRDGVINNGSELFGDYAPPNYRGAPQNGFLYLRHCDLNHDGFIDDRDPVWSALQLWVDINHNGISEPNEMRPISASNIRVLDLEYVETHRQDPNGNALRFRAWLRQGNHREPYYDVYFVLVP